MPKEGVPPDDLDALPTSSFSALRLRLAPLLPSGEEKGQTQVGEVGRGPREEPSFPPTVRFRTVKSLEIVQRALHFGKPPRLPVKFDLLGVSDCAGLWLGAPASFSPSVKNEDEWGCVWVKTGLPNMGQVKGHPLEDLSRMDRMKVPDYDDDSRYKQVEEGLVWAEKEGKYVEVGIFMVLFERMHTLHGFENVLAGLLDDRPAMEALADRIVGVHLEFIDNIGRRFGKRVHGFTMTDDWGTQKAAFIGLPLWLDFFLPRYKRLYDRMHHWGYDVWLHSCGKVTELVEGFIRAGANAANLQQPRALGIEEMGRRYRGRITFESLADIQATLPTGDRRKVEEDAEALAANWMDPRGGFVFSDYGDPAALGIRDDSIKRHMYACFSRASERIYGEPLPPPTP